MYVYTSILINLYPLFKVHRLILYMYFHPFHGLTYLIKQSHFTRKCTANSQITKQILFNHASPGCLESHFTVNMTTNSHFTEKIECQPLVTRILPKAPPPYKSASDGFIIVC